MFKHIKPYTLNDVPFAGDEDKAAKIVALFASQYPVFFHTYIESKIKAAPFGTKLIWFVGPHLYSTAFAKNGIESIPMREVDDLLGRKKKDEPTLDDLIAATTPEPTKKKKK